jgi:hypothetical protein
MPQQLITARLKPGITGLTLYAGQENFIELKDLFEVRDVNGLIITQPTIGGSTASVIDHVISFEATLPTNWQWYGFKATGSPTTWAFTTVGGSVNDHQ